MSWLKRGRVTYGRVLSRRSTAILQRPTAEQRRYMTQFIKKGPVPDLFHDQRFELLSRLEEMWNREIWRQTN